MRKILFPLFILLVSTGHSQNPIQSALKNYFRTHPFDMKFSSFITSLKQDPWFTIDTYGRRTDTSFFFITGTYKNFNPFRFVPKELRLIVAEEEIVHGDSLQTHDTIMNLQLLAISDSGEINSKLVEKEFKRFHNNQASRFSSNTSNSFKEKMAASLSKYIIISFLLFQLLQLFHCFFIGIHRSYLLRRRRFLLS